MFLGAFLLCSTAVLASVQENDVGKLIDLQKNSVNITNQSVPAMMAVVDVSISYDVYDLGIPIIQKTSASVNANNEVQKLPKNLANTTSNDHDFTSYSIIVSTTIQSPAIQTVSNQPEHNVVAMNANENKIELFNQNFKKCTGSRRKFW